MNLVWSDLALKPHVESPALGSIDRPSSPLSGRDTQIEVGAEAACLLNGFQVVSSERYVFSADEGFSQVEEMLAHNLDWKAGENRDRQIMFALARGSWSNDP